MSTVEAKDSRWIVGPLWDLLVFAGPVAIAAVIAVFLWQPSTDMPLWAFLVIVVGVDVAHVWGTLYRTYMDPVEFRRRKLTYVLSPILIFAAAVGVHLYSAALFWTILAYVAIYHFISQQYGLMAVYKYKAGEGEAFDFQLDRITVYAGAAGPVLWWHAQDRRPFDWFNAGEDFFIRLPEEIILPVYFFSALLLTVFIIRQMVLYYRGLPVSPGKLIIVLLSWLTWWVGIYLAPNPVIAAAFINLFHGIPFMGLVWVYCRNKWSAGPSSSAKGVAQGSGARLLRFLSGKGRWVFFIGLLISIGFTEEVLWDYFVWHRYISEFFPSGFQILADPFFSVVVALLVLPQAVHYYLDGLIWKAKSNPGMLEYLGLK